MIKLERANILQAFEPRCVGSRVTDPTGFLLLLTYAVERFDFASQTTPWPGCGPALARGAPVRERGCGPKDGR